MNPIVAPLKAGDRARPSPLCKMPSCFERPFSLRETDERQDIAYLANKTGWPARAVALAALADQFSAKSKAGRGAAGIEPPVFYALLRAGIGANEDALYQVDTGKYSED